MVDVLTLTPRDTISSPLWEVFVLVSATLKPIRKKTHTMHAIYIGLNTHHRCNLFISIPFHIGNLK